MAGTYKIVCKPEDRSTAVEGTDVEENRSCMVVQLVNGSQAPQEVCRVGFARENTTHPDVSLKDQLAGAIARARVAVDVLNDQLTSNGELA